MADRLISADALKAIIVPMVGMFSEGTFYVDYNAILQAIDNAPTIEAEPKHGRWWHYEGTLTCSVCHTEIYDDIMELLGDDVPRYCPNCGAKMGKVMV